MAKILETAEALNEEEQAAILASFRRERSRNCPVPKLGIKISFFQKFIADLGGEEIFTEMTTMDVCDRFVKPATEEQSISYCDYLKIRELNAHYVDTAQAFISHAWKFPFLDVVHALEDHFQHALDTVIWFDLFSNNQHEAPHLDFEWWSTTFKSTIGQFEHVVMVLSPWDDPIPLKRVWCLFELYCAVDSKSHFEVAMTRSEQERFINGLLEDGSLTSYLKMLGTINVERSDASNPQDRALIFEAIRASIGFQQLNRTVFQCLRRWVLQAAHTFADREPKDTERYLGIQCIIAALYLEQGQQDRAEEMFGYVRRARLEKFGEEHYETIRVSMALANVYRLKGRYDESEALFKHGLEVQTRKLGADHVDTLRITFSLANIYRVQRRYQEAENYFIQGLAKQRELLGDDHQNVLLTTINLAATYQAHGRHQDAHRLFQDCLAKQQVVFGPDHPDTLRTTSSLANSFMSLGEFDQAESLYQHVWEKQKILLGESNPITLITMQGLGKAYNALGKQVAAKDIFVECYERQKQTLGAGHSQCQSTLKLLIQQCKKLGDYQQSKKYNSMLQMHTNKSSSVDSVDGR
jgi:tetratricopeptide (TPR) repeat protein